MKMEALPGWRLGRALLGAEWRSHPIRAAVAILAIALGVALGFSIHLINTAAFNEFSAAVRSISGQADLQVRGAQPFIDESLYPLIARHAGVAYASPVLEIDAALPGRKTALKILGIDVMRAAAIAPDLIGTPGESRPYDTLADDAIFLSPAAQQWLGLKPGDKLEARAGTELIHLRVAGGLMRARPGQRIAVMDIGAAQWRFHRIGVISRIDLKLVEGVNREAFRHELARTLGDRALVTETADQETRTSNMSRAYRVNLNMLALVALFTGAFLVFSIQALSVIRRRSQLALLRVIGLTRGQLLAQILLEGLVLGVTGSAIGLAAGYGMAAAALRLFGGDLGGGYFPGVQPTVHFTPIAALVFFGLGTTVALLGCASPAWEAARARPAPALKAGSEDISLSRLASPWPALACLLLGVLCTRLPPVQGLPVFGYVAVMLLLIGGIALMPRFCAWAFGGLMRVLRLSAPVPELSLARLANAPNQAGIALGGVLSSFSLMVAMAIMVASFRVSVDDWLGRVLAGDLYVHAAANGNTATLGLREQEALLAQPVVAGADFLRVTQLTLDPRQPPVALLARPIDVARPERILPLTGDSLDPSRIGRAMPVWVSEAMVDLYGYRPGATIRLPIGTGEHEFIVAGIWRDYARQSGAIQIRLPDYRTLTSDTEINDVALHLRPGVTPAQAVSALRALPFGAALEFSEPGEIRAVSLRIFDRSFAVTYLLEGVAIIIGLFGVAATFSAQTLARSREFGMLRHIGVSRRQILGMLALEGGLLATLGIAAGFIIGSGISLILVFIVNPQSFHWTMQWHAPWRGLLAAAGAMLLSAGLTALVAGRQAVAMDAVRAVREDW